MPRCSNNLTLTGAWPLQDIRLLIRGLCTSQYSSWHSTPHLLPPPPLYFAINTAQYIVFPRPPPCVAIQYTRFAMAISCKGQNGVGLTLSLGQLCSASNEVPSPKSSCAFCARLRYVPGCAYMYCQPDSNGVGLTLCC